ncbi:MAG TPA: hypothetical protein VG777_09355 [Thermoanaerobaculia bacterium]|nr:hypothetical protein [Thermoanaerobaculia bacterium]
MSGAAWTALVGAGAFAAAAAALSEARWRSLAARELPEEVALGALGPEDFEALRSWRRFRRSWLDRGSERRALRTIAARLARAKAEQRRAESDRRKLLQVQILTLRTRLRRALAGRATRRETAD